MTTKAKPRSTTKKVAPKRKQRAKPPGRMHIMAGTPGQWDDFWYDDVQTGARVPRGFAYNPDSAMRVSTVAACVRLIADSIASLPCKLYRKSDSGGKESASESPLYTTLHDAPNDDQTAFEYWEAVAVNLLLRGNFYAIKLGTPGRGISLWPVHPDHVRVARDGMRRIYEVKLAGGTQVFVGGEIHHVMGLSMDGLTGISPIRYHASSIGAAAAFEEHGIRTFQNGAAIRGVLEHPGRFRDKERIEQLRRQWQDTYGGPMNAGKTAILEDGMVYKALSMTNDDAQWLESRKYQRTEICAIFRVPPHKVGDLERATFSNIEHQQIEYVTDTLRPWLVRIEQAIKRDLLADEPQLYAEFLADALLRGDAQSRTNALHLQFRSGAITLNEWRSLENRNPVPGELGDTHFVPKDLATIEQVASGDTADAAVDTRPPMYQQEDDQNTDDGADAAPLVQDAAERIFAAEHRAVERRAVGSSPQGEAALTRRATWLDGKQMPYVARVLAPLSMATRRVDAGESATVELRASTMADVLGTAERAGVIRAILEKYYGR